ncbi:MAG: hypothetical protein AB7I27_05915 [Bacteriovoracaceae bacterium]
MGEPKIKTPQLKKLYSVEDKKIVETLIKSLNDKIQKDPKLAKKAALILEDWLKKTRP